MTWHFLDSRSHKVGSTVANFIKWLDDNNNEDKVFPINDQAYLYVTDGRLRLNTTPNIIQAARAAGAVSPLNEQSLVASLVSILSKYHRHCYDLNRSNAGSDSDLIEYGQPTKQQLVLFVQKELLEQMHDLELAFDPDINNDETIQNLDNQLETARQTLKDKLYDLLMTDDGLKQYIDNDNTLSDSDRDKLKKQLRSLYDQYCRQIDEAIDNPQGFFYSDVKSKLPETLQNKHTQTYKYNKFKNLCYQMIDITRSINAALIFSHSLGGDQGYLKEQVLYDADAAIRQARFPDQKITQKDQGDVTELSSDDGWVHYPLDSSDPEDAKYLVNFVNDFQSVQNQDIEANSKAPSFYNLSENLIGFNNAYNVNRKIVYPFLSGWREHSDNECIRLGQGAFNKAWQLPVNAAEDVLSFVTVPVNYCWKGQDIPRGTWVNTIEQWKKATKNADNIEGFLQAQGISKDQHSATYKAITFAANLSHKTVSGAIYTFYSAIALRVRGGLEEGKSIKSQWTKRPPQLTEQQIDALIKNLDEEREAFLRGLRSQGINDTESFAQNRQHLETLLTKYQPRQEVKTDTAFTLFKGIRSFFNLFEIPIARRSPYMAFLFSATYLAAGYLISPLADSINNPVKDGVNAVAKAMSGEVLGQIIAAAFTFAKLVAGVYDLKKGEHSFINHLMNKLVDNCVPIGAGAALSYGVGYYMSNGEHVPDFIQEHFKKDVGNWPFLAQMFIGLKLLAIFYEFVKPDKQQQEVFDLVNYVHSCLNHLNNFSQTESDQQQDNQDFLTKLSENLHLLPYLKGGDKKLVENFIRYHADDNNEKAQQIKNAITKHPGDGMLGATVRRMLDLPSNTLLFTLANPVKSLLTMAPSAGLGLGLMTQFGDDIGNFLLVSSMLSSYIATAGPILNLCNWIEEKFNDTHLPQVHQQDFEKIQSTILSDVKDALYNFGMILVEVADFSLREGVYHSLTDSYERASYKLGCQSRPKTNEGNSRSDDKPLLSSEPDASEETNDYRSTHSDNRWSFWDSVTHSLSRAFCCSRRSATAEPVNTADESKWMDPALN